MNKTIEYNYERRVIKYQAFLEKTGLGMKKLIRAKLITLFGGLGVSATLFVMHFWYLGAGILTAVFFLYFYLNKLHDKGIYYQTLGKNLLMINQSGIKRLNGEWTTFPDKGDDLADPDHFYAQDLDITGQGSVFQHLNSSATFWGRQKLKSLLFTHPESVEKIRSRQEAVCELAKNLSFRQRLQAEGMSVTGDREGTETILGWARKVNEKLLEKKTRLFFRILPLFTLVLCSLGYFHIVPWILPSVFILIQILLLKWKSKERMKTLNTAYAFKYKLQPFRKTLERIEQKSFTASHLREIKAGMYLNHSSPSQQLVRLSGICGNISNRNNMFYFLLDIFTLWDYQCEIALEQWKKECGSFLAGWFEGIGALEALSSLSNLMYDNPGWAIPEVTETEALYLEAVQAGHPLIAKGRVVNDFNMGGTKKAVLITGSNMSGKSTFLRTIGINLILAYAGAPVCASSFSCSRMNVYTCMRISDNLEKNISSFYAELLRIKMVVDAVRHKGNVFFLLDEIFKGTNSYDRHYAAKVLITKLSGNNSIGLVSTHDLELEVLEKESGGQIVNSHFQERYDQGRILFDYKLLPGVSKTRNAIYLIEALGIDLK